MSDLERVLDDIDALVDASLAEGEPRTGYDYGDPTYPSCPHCDRAWHGLPVTEKIAEMYDWTGWDDTYIVAEDDSPVLCPGSEFIGPVQARKVRGSAFTWTISDGQGNLI